MLSHAHGALVVTLAVLAPLSTACMSVIQPGFIDPADAQAAAVGSTTVSVAGGALVEGLQLSGEGVGGAVRVEHQLSAHTGAGGEVFGGAGRAHGPFGVPTLYWPDGVAGAAGVRAFVDHNVGVHTLVRSGVSASAVSGGSSQEALVGLASAELAHQFGDDEDGVTPYVFAGLFGGAAMSGLALSTSVAPLTGGHVGAGVRAPLGEGWSWHVGSAMQTRTVLDGSILFGLAMPNALVNVGMHRAF